MQAKRLPANVLSDGNPQTRGARAFTNYVEARIPRILSLKKLLLVFLLLLLAAIATSAARHFWIGDGRGNWQTADRSSAGLLPPASAHPEAVIRVFAARIVRWRAIFAFHTWIVVKEKSALPRARRSENVIGVLQFRRISKISNIRIGHSRNSEGTSMTSGVPLNKQTFPVPVGMSHRRRQAT